MGIQGVLSILDEASNVRVKVVVGCSAQNLDLLVEAYQNDPDRFTEPSAVYAAAAELHVGCRECLVVLDGKNHWAKDGKAKKTKAMARYYATFQDRFANPRWEQLVAGPTLVVNSLGNLVPTDDLALTEEDVRTRVYREIDAVIEVNNDLHVRSKQAIDALPDPFHLPENVDPDIRLALIEANAALLKVFVWSSNKAAAVAMEAFTGVESEPTEEAQA